jgi:hypothetical protein
MNRVPRVAQSRADMDGGRSGDTMPASNPVVAPFGRQPSRLGPGDAWILVAFTASVLAGIVIWGLALGYLRF